MANILILEDDSRTCGFISEHLEAAGHTCLVHRTGDKALEAAKHGAVELAVLDVMLPGVSGFELCRRFRADSELYTLPILILSAMASEEEVMHGFAQGADDYICKPFDVKDLVQRVDALLRSDADAASPDDVTSLPGAAAIKREVQKRVSRHDVFALLCAELMHLREFTFHCGTDAREKAVRHLARALRLCGEEPATGDFMAGHMGGGHFVSVLKAESVEHYCGRVREVWDAHVPKFYDSLGQRKAYRDALAGKPRDITVPIIELLICTTARDGKSTLSARQMFEVLTQIRNNALAQDDAGVHIDRRTSSPQL